MQGRSKGSARTVVPAFHLGDAAGIVVKGTHRFQRQMAWVQL